MKPPGPDRESSSPRQLQSCVLVRRLSNVTTHRFTFPPLRGPMIGLRESVPVKRFSTAFEVLGPVVRALSGTRVPSVLKVLLRSVKNVTLGHPLGNHSRTCHSNHTRQRSDYLQELLLQRRTWYTCSRTGLSAHRRSRVESVSGDGEVLCLGPETQDTIYTPGPITPYLTFRTLFPIVLFDLEYTCLSFLS